MEEQLANTWQIHQRMNMLLMDNITDAGMQQTLSTPAGMTPSGRRGGRTVYQQWVHIHNVRVQWLEVCAKDIFKKYKPLDKEAPFDRKALKKALEDSASGIEELLLRSWKDNGKVKGFRKGVLPMLGYFISHESHHRGNILLTLKQSGEKIPDAVKWGLWEWSKGTPSEGK
ncbi:MAG: DinB family protein [Bacteroidota bacterium]